ncbi:MAG: PhoH family protein [Patescibacteria group bacterium]|jgi:PhoH-like ATPase
MPAVKQPKPLPVNPGAKIYVLDTSTILNSAGIIDILGDNVIVVPIWVIEELDGMKKGVSEKARIARNFSKLMDKYREQGKLTEGVSTQAGGLLFVSCEMAEWGDLPAGMQSNNDNRIVMVARKWSLDYPERRVVVLSCDVNQRIKADVMGVEAQNYQHNETSYLLDRLYSDITRVQLLDSQGGFLVELHQKGFIPAANFSDRQLDNLHSNECCYLCLGDKSAMVIYKQGVGFNLVPKPKLQERDKTGIIKPVGPYQAFASALLADDDIIGVSFDGVPGAGKSVLPIHYALKSIAAGKHQSLVVFRPYDFRGMGFLKGDAEQKFGPYTDAILSRIGEALQSLRNERCAFFQERGINTVADLKAKGFFEIRPIDFVAGETILNSVVIIDEVQNFTWYEAYLLCTRPGDGCKIIVNGDLSQIRDRDRMEDNGLVWVIKKNIDHPAAAHLSLRSNVRRGPSSIYA